MHTHSSKNAVILTQYLKWTNPHRNTLVGSNEGLSNWSHEQRARSDMNTDDAIIALFPENEKDT